MRLEDCSLFIEIVRSESLSGAARTLSYSPAAITARLNALEKELGCRLINRTTRSFQLTDEGQHFLELAQRMCSEVAIFKAGVQHSDGVIKGVIRVTSTYDFGHRYIAPAIKAFVDTYPEVRIELTLSDTVIDIVECGIDLAIRFGELPDSSLVARKIPVENRRVLVAAKSFLEKAGPINCPKALTRLSCIINKRAQGSRYQWFYRKNAAAASPPDTVVDDAEKEATASPNQTAIDITPQLTCNDGSQVYRWLKDGAGIGLKSYCDVAQDLAEGSLVEVLPDYTFEYQNGNSQKSGISFVYPNRHLLSPRLKRFMDFLESALKEQLSPISKA